LGAIAAIALFSLCMMIKGGWLGKMAWYRKTFADKYIEGKWLSGLLLSAFINPIFGLFWALGNSPRMNDPGGDWKLAVQRGMFLGACLTMATGLTGYPNIWFIISGATLPIWYRLALWQSKGAGWALAEPMLGAALGVAAIFGSTLVTLPRW